MVNVLEQGEGENLVGKNSGPINIIETSRQRKVVLENEKDGIELVKADKGFAKVAQLAQVADLKGQLNDNNNAESILNSCQERFNDGKEYFNSISGDKEKLNKKINSMENNTLSILLNSISTSFSHLENVDDKKLKEEYLKYFEPQNSKYYLGTLIVALESKSFSRGFFSAMNGGDRGFDEEFNKVIKIVQRLVTISTKL